MPLALDNVVRDHGFTEVSSAQAEQAFLSGRGSRAGDDVVVADDEFSEGSFVPDHTATGIAHEIVVKQCGAWRSHAPEPAYEVAAVLLHIEVEQVVADLDIVAGKLDSLAGREVIVVDVERPQPVFQHPAPSMLGNGDDSAQDVVIDLDPLVAFEWKLD